ncbi:MAG: plasmid pRiA4b ORF-3 family protein [Planctomycetota bacterium]|nr:plasmid pRiA4b ORF-3 family protein [Planctomycetota bacterium]
MPRKTPAITKPVYQIKITLLGSRPSIWRRVLVPSDFTLEELHWIIQAAMPWTNSHLHQFIDKSGKFYSDPRFGLGNLADETRTPLSDLLGKPKDWIIYEYDFGDGWEHSVELEKIVAHEAKQKLPVCVAGKRAAPPDDCGGIGGYAHLLDVLKDPEHDEHDDMIEWLGGTFDPAVFDPAEFERAARRLRLR